MKQILAILTLSSLFLSSTLLAQNTNKSTTTNLPIDLVADNGVFDANSNTATYTGNVVITQGEMILKGDKMKITLKDGEVEQIENWGNLAYFHYVPQDQPPVDGKGKYMLYRVEQDTIDIDGDAWVKQEDNETNANHITYHIGDERVQGQNVKMTLIPKSKNRQ